MMKNHFSQKMKLGRLEIVKKKKKMKKMNKRLGDKS